jgi:dTDP-4-amino-4,6-dideoxygalactose transaminase
MLRLEEQGIATRPGTHAPPLQGYYRSKYGYSEQSFPAATLAQQLSLALPLYPQMTDAEQDTVCEALVDAHGA